MAEIWNETPNTLISGTNDNDSIYNYHNGLKVAMSSGKGNDNIYN